MKIKKVYVFSKEDFRKWLENNHNKERIVELLIHKKHTGKKSPSHKELIDEAICYGWIDTIIRKVDEDRFIRTFQKRNEKSKWSLNTLGYAKKLIKDKRMTKHGLKFYHEGRKKKAFDHGIPKNPEPPKELIAELNKNKIAKKNFESLSDSARRTYMRWLFYAKTLKTKEKRIDFIIKKMSKKNGKRGLF